MTALRVMIASPSDVADARNEIEDALLWWNRTNTWKRGIVLIPWRWEASAIPQVGDKAQSVINSQGVDDADVVFALFAGRLGSPTAESLSGTVEEIERAVASGKAVHIYFSEAPLPNNIDIEQLQSLRVFRTELESRGLLGTYSSLQDLKLQVLQAVEHDVSELQERTPASATEVDRTPPGARFSVQPRDERELNGFGTNGRPRYTTRHWLEVTNDGSEDASDVRFSVPVQDSSLHLFDDGPTVIHAGQTRKVTVVHTMGGGGPDIVRIAWSDSTGQNEKEFHV